MRLNQFEKRFPNKDSCVSYYKTIREPLLPVCPTCGNHKYSWIESKRVFECKSCRRRISLTNGTVMEHSKQDIRDWFYVMHLMTSIKQVLSAKEVQYQLGKKHYSPVWLMMMKLRSVMGIREDEYKLRDTIEVDQAFFPTRTEKDYWYRQKSGVGSQQQTKVLVIVESKPVDNVIIAYGNNSDNFYNGKIRDFIKKTKHESIKKVVHYLKMIVIEDMKSETVDEIMMKYVDPNAFVVTDGSTSFVNFQKHFRYHVPYVEGDNPEEIVKTHLPWVHVLIGECRNGILAIHKDVDKRFLQLYLNEYCWKFNRRRFRDSAESTDDLFERLVRISARYTSDIKWRYYQKVESEDDEV